MASSALDGITGMLTQILQSRTANITNQNFSFGHGHCEVAREDSQSSTEVDDEGTTIIRTVDQRRGGVELSSCYRNVILYHRLAP